MDDPNPPKYQKDEQVPHLRMGRAYIIVGGCKKCGSDMLCYYGVAHMCTKCELKMIGG